MSKHIGREPTDRWLKYLIESADECLRVAGGYRLRLARSNTMLLLVIGAIEANPALRLTMTIDETGACWLDIRMHEPSSSSPGEEHQTPKGLRTTVVA